MTAAEGAAALRGHASVAWRDGVARVDADFCRQLATLLETVQAERDAERSGTSDSVCGMTIRSLRERLAASESGLEQCERIARQQVAGLTAERDSARALLAEAARLLRHFTGREPADNYEQGDALDLLRRIEKEVAK